jgi:hypothetical protein
LPDLTYPTLTIRTNTPAQAPAEIENLITKPIEEALGVVKNVQQVRSIRAPPIRCAAWSRNQYGLRQPDVAKTRCVATAIGSRETIIRASTPRSIPSCVWFLPARARKVGGKP